MIFMGHMDITTLVISFVSALRYLKHNQPLQLEF